MSLETTKRYINCINHLKSQNIIPSFRQLALAIDIHPQCISDILRSKRDVNCDIIQRTVEKFGINPNYVFTGFGAFLSKDDNNTNEVFTIVTDNENNERIAHIPIAAQAGYGEQITDPIFISQLETFSLPGQQFNHGSFRSFDVKGDSMTPTLNTGDIVVCKNIDRYNWRSLIKNNHVYVIITQSDVIVKRVMNKLKSEGHILVKSDNDYYPPREIDLREIKEVWQVELKISSLIQKPTQHNTDLQAEVSLLKNTISDQSRLIESLNRTIERLLKQNRTSMIR